MSEIQAKLVRKIESGKAWYFDKYELECIDCGRHYCNGRFDSRTVPYCNDCKRKHDKERTEKLKEERRKAYEKNIRDNAIDDFFKELQKYEESDGWLRLKMSSIYEIADEMRGSEENG